MKLTRMLHIGSEDQGKYGKRGKLLLHCSSTGTPDRDIPVGEGWSIARRCIAVAMDQRGSINLGSQIFPDKFVWNEFEQLRWPEGRRAGCPE